MRSKLSKGIHLSVFLVACVCFTTLFSSAAHATSIFPWDNEHSVAALLIQQPQPGQSVVCTATVGRISGRCSSPFFVLEDRFRAVGEPYARIVVLCRPPVTLRSGQSISLEGKLGRLPNSSELYIYDPTIYAFFKDGIPQHWLSLPGPAFGYEKVTLPIPEGPLPPSNPGIADDGLGVPSEVSAYITDSISRFDTVSSLLETPPPVLSLVELSTKPVISAGEGYLIAGDSDSNAEVRCLLE